MLRRLIIAAAAAVAMSGCSLFFPSDPVVRSELPVAVRNTSAIGVMEFGLPLCSGEQLESVTARDFDSGATIWEANAFKQTQADFVQVVLGESEDSSQEAQLDTQALTRAQSIEVRFEFSTERSEEIVIDRTDAFLESRDWEDSDYNTLRNPATVSQYLSCE